MSSERQEVADRLHSAALHLVRAVRTVDRAMGLSPARASALSVLVFGGPRTVGELAEAEGVRSPTMTALVSGLEADGFVRRVADRGDGRRVLVRATAKGSRVLRRGRARRVALLEHLLEGVGQRDLARLDRAAALMEAAAARSQAPAGA
ncbi:MAG: MarR family winged helix-turn-helix transcriptional regulator [Acidimicrobiia bacterium]